MEPEGAAAVTPEECETNAGQNPSLEGVPKQDGLDTTEPILTPEVAEKTTEAEKPQTTEQAEGITEPNAPESEILKVTELEECIEIENSKSGIAKSLNDLTTKEDEAAGTDAVSKDDITIEQKVEDSIGNLAAVKLDSENPENVSNENEAEGRLRRQNASHKLVEGVRITSQASTEQN